VDYVPWPEKGCCLAEARERTADRAAWKVLHDGLTNIARHKSEQQKDKRSGDRGDPELVVSEVEDRIEADFRKQMTTRRLVAYGRAGHPDAASRLISRDIWLTLPRIDWENSSIGADRRAGNAFFAVRTFPALLAPCRLELIQGRSLSDTFKKFVLEDPEVAALAKRAVALCPEFERVFLYGHCYVHGIKEWPVTFERRGLIGVVHPDPKRRWEFGVSRKPDPVEVAIAADALLHRYGVLIGLLRRGELEGQGLPAISGDSGMILQSIWSHRDFHINVDGDVFQINKESENPPLDLYTRRWIGVVLRRGSSTASSDGSKEHCALANLQTDEQPFSLDVAPFTVTEVLQIGSLSAALAQLVFRHPRIRNLRANALALAEKQHIPFEEDAGLVGIVYGHDEPLLPLRYFSTEEVDLSSLPIEPLTPEEEAISAKYFDPLPEIEAYCDAVNLHAGTLFRMLQAREVVALAHTVRGDLVQLAQSIWDHADFYIHPPTGDIYEACPGRMIKRWTGVIFSAPATLLSSDQFHVKHIPSAGLRLAATEEQSDSSRRKNRRGRKSEIVLAAIAKSGLDLNACELGPKEIAAKIQKHLPNPPTTKEEWEALSKMIARIRASRSSPRA
jgi:hypothetical protein